VQVGAEDAARTDAVPTCVMAVAGRRLADLAGRGVATRVYVPYGPDWFRYWLRRVAESRAG
jgi:proline dehydrogenase